MFSIPELIEIFITILALAYIFQDLFMRRRKIFGKKAFLHSALLSTLSVILHELAHKLVATSFGLKAIYRASWIGLGLGAVLRTFRLPIFFIPAYVALPPNVPPLESALIGIAGPLTNFFLFIGVNLTRRFKERANRFLRILDRINLLLFFFNLIPFPGTDGYHFFFSLAKILG